MGNYYDPNDLLWEALTDLMLTLFQLPDELEAIRIHLMTRPYTAIDTRNKAKARKCLEKLISTTNSKMKQLIEDLAKEGILLVDLNSDNQPDRLETKKIKLWVESYKKQQKISEDSLAVLKALPN
jgi:predicted kinase